MTGYREALEHGWAAIGFNADGARLLRLGIRCRWGSHVVQMPRR
jgi:hypothetical protein